MKTYDLIIIGGGGGLKLRPAADLGKKIAIIEMEDLGGTCLNRGCIPSKMLIHAADVADEIRDAHKFQIDVDTDFKVRFEELVNRVTASVVKSSNSIAPNYEKHPNIDFYPHQARFIEDKIIEVNGEKITADKIVIAVGTRPLIPPIEGLKETPFMTSREALRNTVQPKKMIVIGGGYIATELGHFYGALGTEVHFLVRSKLLSSEDSEIAAEFTRVFSEKYHVHLGTTPSKVSHDGAKFILETSEGEMRCDSLFVATGIQPNSDTLSLENTSIEIDEKGYIKTNLQLQTTAPEVYAIGDVNGRYFFRHSVNFEGEYLLRTLFEDPSDEEINYPPMPHAVFSSPQVAGVGKTEDELKSEGADYVKGMNYYKDSAMGDAILADHGFCKILVDRKSKKLFGAHIVGPEASNMIHMLIAFINMNATLDDMLRTIYIHPALPEIVRNACRKAKNALST